DVFVRRSVRDLLPGDHAWLPFSTDEEQGHVIGSWVQDGLRIQDKVIYVIDAEPWELPGLYGQDLREEVRQGLLTLIPVGEACLTGGMFDHGKMLDTLGDEIKKAQEQEYRGIRVTSEMSWALQQPFGDTRVELCEQELGERVCPSVSVTAICQTDRRRCGPDQLRLLSDHHEVRVIPNPDFDDPVLSITRTYSPLGLHLRGELDGARHSPFSEALNHVTPNGETIHLDLGELAFMSLGALQEMTNYTRRRGRHSRIVLDNVPEHLRSLITVVGEHRLPGIELGDSP
ncbi:MAG: MEDS domain-containing protein, partial [Streptosporangiaceae bacterium]